MPQFIRGGFSTRNILSKGGYSAVGVSVVGAEDVQDAFAQLAKRGSKRAASAGMSVGAQVLTKHIKRINKAKVGQVTGTLQKSIQWRMRRKRKEFVTEAIAGYNVGATQYGFKRTNRGTLKNTSVLAPHAHLVALGTLKRWRKKIGGKFAYLEKANIDGDRRTTGIMPHTNVIAAAYAQSKGEAVSKIKERIRVTLEKEERRVRRKRK